MEQISVFSSDTRTRDFVPRAQLSHSIRSHDLDSTRTFKLRWLSPDIQTWAPLQDLPAALYTVTIIARGLVGKKINLHVSKREAGRSCRVADIGFDRQRGSTDISYYQSNTNESVSPESSFDQTQDCTIFGAHFVWQPLGPSKVVVELSNARHQRLALFVRPGEVALTNNARTGKRNVQSQPVSGELHILQDAIALGLPVDEIVCSASAVVNHARLRLTSNGSPRHKSN